MSTYLDIHPDNPQARLLAQAAALFEKKAVLAIYPTDSGYAMGARLGDKKGLQRLAQYCKRHQRHFLSMLCPDISTVSEHAYVDNVAFKYMKARTPGPYTFILRPKQHIVKQGLPYKRHTLGVRIVHAPVLLGLLTVLSEPLMSVSLQASSTSVHPPIFDYMEEEETIPTRVSHCPKAIFADHAAYVDLMLSVGSYCSSSSTVIDLTTGKPTVLREGQDE